MQICEKEKCTGCGACAYSCPHQVIAMQEDEIGVLRPMIDDASCINCGKCERMCPANKDWEFYPIEKTYVAWSSDPEERRTSASGGIAAEIYRYTNEQGFVCVGAKSNPNFSVSLIATENYGELRKFKNSKYVFCDAQTVYPQIEQALKENKTVIFVGLPCQVAAVRQLFPKKENLLLIDLVCHGVMPYSYLKQHIQQLERDYGKKAGTMSFRDENKGTCTFTLTLYDSTRNCFYARRTKDWDTYQVGYHRMIAYRENCYHCKYAKTERISDVTLSDYKGLGSMAPWDLEAEKVSSILVHTERGMELIKTLMDQGRIIAHERPLLESVSGDPQLQHPSLKSPSRLDFEKYIELYHGDFEKTMEIVIRKRKHREATSKVVGKLKRVMKQVINRK